MVVMIADRAAAGVPLGSSAQGGARQSMRQCSGRGGGPDLHDPHIESGQGSP
jgi:hypothetical protein